MVIRVSLTRQTQLYARHGRVTTRAAGGATELLEMAFLFVVRCGWV